MSERIKRNISFLQDLGNSSSSNRIVIINNATEDNLDALTELMINVLNGNLQINGETKALLSKHKILIRTLSKKTIPGAAKKRNLLKKIKVIPIVLTPILSALGSVIGKIVSSHLNL